MQDLRSTFSSLPLSKLLSWLRNNRHSGLLRVSHGQQRKEFHLRDGVPFSFRSNCSNEQLETVLAKQGVAELTSLQQLRNECRQDNRSYAKELIERQLLSRTEFQLWLKQSLNIALDDALQWPDGSFTFRFLSAEQVGRPMAEKPQPPPETEAAQKIEKKILAEEEIFSEINHQIVTGQVTLPPMPDTLLKLRHCLSNPDWDSRDLLKIIMTDQLLTSSILKAANSSRYGFTNQVSSLQHAIVLMGMKSILGIVTHHSLLSSFSHQQQRLQQVLDHSFLCAIVAKQIAAISNVDEEDAFSCALLHDIGKTVLLNQFTNYDLAMELQEKLIDRFHAEAGLLIAAKWNLPELVLEAIEHHHQPDQATANHTLVEIVYLANCLANHRNPLFEQLQDVCPSLNLSRAGFDKLIEQVEQLEQTLNP